MDLVRETRLDIIKNLDMSFSRDNFGIFNQNSKTNAVITAAFALGMFPNLLIKSYKSNQLQLINNQQTFVKVGSTSVVSEFLSNQVEPMIWAYGSMQIKKNNKGQQEATVWDLSKVNPISYMLLGGSQVEFNPLSQSFTIDSKLTFTCTAKTGTLILGLRKSLKRLEARVEEWYAQNVPELDILVQLIS